MPDEDKKEIARELIAIAEEHPGPWAGDEGNQLQSIVYRESYFAMETLN